MISGEVRGVRRLSDGLGMVADELGDLSAPGSAAGELVVGKARGRAPVLTGALAAGIEYAVEGTQVQLIAGVPYAGIQEWGSRYVQGTRYLTSSLDEETDRILEGYTMEIQRDLGRVRGA